MTTIEFSVSDEAGDADVLVSGLTADGVAEAPDGLGDHLAARGFKADLGSTVLVPRDGGARASSSAWVPRPWTPRACAGPRPGRLER